MTRIAIAGAAGRMGRELVIAALADPDIDLVAGFEVPGSTALGLDLAAHNGRPAIGVTISSDPEQALSKANVLVEFTAPTATVEHVSLAARMGVAAIIGTTGLSGEQIDIVRQASKRVPVVLSPNMSVGVNVLLDVLPRIVGLLGPGYDVELIEAHHSGKKDAPSGTALKIAEVIASALEVELAEVASYGRRGLAPRKSGEIGIHAVRAGAIVGDHRVVFANEGEQIEIIHRAFSRQNFALGAMRAATFVAHQQPGLYSMADVLSS